MHKLSQQDMHPHSRLAIPRSFILKLIIIFTFYVFTYAHMIFATRCLYPARYSKRQHLGVEISYFKMERVGSFTQLISLGNLISRLAASFNFCEHVDGSHRGLSSLFSHSNSLAPIILTHQHGAMVHATILHFLIQFAFQIIYIIHFPGQKLLDSKKRSLPSSAACLFLDGTIILNVRFQSTVCRIIDCYTPSSYDDARHLQGCF